MTSTLDPLLEATRLLAQAWGDAGSGTDLSRAQLVAVNDALGLVKRSVPVEAQLLAEDIPAAQETLVDPDVGLHVRPVLR